MKIRYKCPNLACGQENEAEFDRLIIEKAIEADLGTCTKCGNKNTIQFTAGIGTKKPD